MSDLARSRLIREQLKPKGLRPSVFWRIAEDIPPRLYWRLVTLSVLLPLAVWWLVTGLKVVDPTFLPAPAQVMTAAMRLGRSGELWRDTVASVGRVGLGFGLSALVAIPVGLLMGSFRSLRALGEPLFGLMRYMPAPAFIPLLILYQGIGEEPKVTLIFIGTFFFNALMVMDTVKFVPKELIESTYMLGGNRAATVMQVIFPHVLPGVLDACRINLAAAWQLVIVAELVAATEGLGRRISLAGRFLRTDEIFVGIIVIGLIGLGFDLLFQYLVRLTCPWSDSQ
ncbi:binding-protein-dependent transport systems inner membrane component [Gloeomargarita lithophora Alchichica-D10]|uniref:Binding-protein-dependent transport systems inner membrane component n=1 Tax=Gloeomargarita lithophora Alchichica-D10 TaxID=1188229 RepID=A0A1J0AEI4_9CYAN|nr:ABC transporter permease [Gloeomargarita lithophora]APB34307.1 binding-protein-dependent transport systems inner membrane component [Gloeomargarita lithophora Alchichica-D10]